MKNKILLIFLFVAIFSSMQVFGMKRSKTPVAKEIKLVSKEGTGIYISRDLAGRWLGLIKDMLDDSDSDEDDPEIPVPNIKARELRIIMKWLKVEKGKKAEDQMIFEVAEQISNLDLSYVKLVDLYDALNYLKAEDFLKSFWVFLVKKGQRYYRQFKNVFRKKKPGLVKNFEQEMVQDTKFFAKTYAAKKEFNIWFEKLKKFPEFLEIIIDEVWAIASEKVREDEEEAKELLDSIKEDNLLKMALRLSLDKQYKRSRVFDEAVVYEWPDLICKVGFYSLGRDCYSFSINATDFSEKGTPNLNLLLYIFPVAYKEILKLFEEKVFIILSLEKGFDKCLLDALFELPFYHSRLLYLEMVGFAICRNLSRFKNLEELIIKNYPKESLDNIVNLSNLKKLFLIDCYELKDLPKDIRKLRSLEVLFLSGCKKLKFLPYSIGDLKRLSHLELNGLDAFEFLPNSIGDCNKLDSLILINCKLLKFLPFSIGKLKQLELLELVGLDNLGSFPHIALALPNSIGKLSNLKNLYVDDCDELSVFPQSLRDLKNLELLYYKSFKIKRRDEGEGDKDRIINNYEISSLNRKSILLLKDLKKNGVSVIISD